MKTTKKTTKVAKATATKNQSTAKQANNDERLAAILDELLDMSGKRWTGKKLEAIDEAYGDLIAMLGL